MKTYCRLSITATCIRNYLKFPDVVSRLIGRYCGTDLTKIPGDIYIRRGSIPLGRFLTIRALIPGGPQFAYYFKGLVYHKYRITSVTACFFKCEHIETFYILRKQYNFPGEYIVSFVCKEAHRPNRIFKGTQYDELELSYFNQLKYITDKATEVPLFFITNLRFDVLNGQLILPKNKNDPTTRHNQPNITIS